MKSDEIRNAYLNFFVEKKHKILPSASLIPHGDPTLLLTTAGMVQVKPYFLGIAVPPNPRLTSCQKCFRTTDIDSVGDNKHLTFFEMLGNFSVGDYFKKEAIEWAWEFVIERMYLRPEKLWVTIYLDDDEAYDIWKSIGFPENKIVRLGDKDNFWGPAGDSGPCGPCSEIHYDFGEKYGCGSPECGPDCSCGRFSEIWNLVFTEFNQSRDGSRTRLPKPNIDTGMGLERIVAASQNNPTVYDTDLFNPMIQEVCSISGLPLGKDESVDRSIKVIAEHSRGITFLLADGLLPSNEGRGYVLRRILRRACFLGRKIGINKPFLADMASTVIAKMGTVYQELETNRKLVLDVINNEEEKFNATLDSGINLCEKAIIDAKSQKRDCLLSEDVFKFWDTYGFPFELSVEIAGEHDLKVDQAGFEAEMDKQREKARSSHQFVNQSGAASAESLSEVKVTEFIGYEKLASSSTVMQILTADTGCQIDYAETGQQIILVLDKTPFYGEMGGQVGDTGTLVSEKARVNVTGAIAPITGKVALPGTVLAGSIKVGDTVEARVDEERRMDIARNHTATHILQAVLRKILGTHVAQRGSLVAPERLRFDFAQLHPIDKAQLKEIQAQVNEIIRKDLPLFTESCEYDKAISEGAMAIFEEKYGDTVRVVKIGSPGISAELCGGTHVRSTGEIGYFLIISEASIGTGLRRIEAVTGRGAESVINEKFEILDQVAAGLRTTITDIPAKLENLNNRLDSSNKMIASLQREISSYEIDNLIENHLIEINNVKVISARVPSLSKEALMEMGDILKAKMRSGVVVLGTVNEDKPFFIATGTPDVVKKGVHCGKLVKQVAQIAGGSGGGKPDMAQAGAKDKAKIEEALKAAPDFVKELLNTSHD
ncbi:MAG: alanine--tRNA ligase [Dehalococcoidia bacterium]|nr:alanine--tRNA ligase [Dehalococcoidia bacterium]